MFRELGVEGLRGLEVQGLRVIFDIGILSSYSLYRFHS